MADYKISATLSLRDQFTAKLNAAIKSAEKLSRGVADFKDRDINYRIGVKGMEQLQRYQSMMKAAGMTIPKPVTLNVNENGATSKLTQIKSSLQSITGRAWNAALNIKTNGAAALSKVKGNLTELATGAAFGLGAGMLGTAGIGYGAVNAVQTYMEYEKQLSAVQAVIGYDKSQMGALAEEARRIGYTTKFTAADAARAMYYQGMAGWREEQMLSGTKGIVNLAAAGNVDLAVASDIVTDLMTGFGLKAGVQLKMAGKPIQEASQFFDDTMAALITSANTDLVQAKEALKYSAPVVSSMYADKSDEVKAQAMQDAFIITGLMANSGVKGSMAGTSQRSLFTRLASENRNAYFAERALPVSFIDETTGEVRRIRDVVKDFREKFLNGLDADSVTNFAEEISGEKIHADTRRKLNSFIENVQKNGGKMTGADKLKMTSMLAGQEAMSGWLSVFLASEEDWDKLAASIDNAQGKAQSMADIQMDNLAGDLTKLSSAWEGVNLAIMEGSAGGGLRDFTQGITDILSTANNLFKDGVQFTDIFALIGTALDKLKSKFLAFDGIGSILAGGALAMALKKLASLALNVKDTLSGWSKVRTAGDLSDVIRGNKTPPIGTSQVGTMTVNAGVVNVNGNVRGGGTTRSQQYADDYYRRRETILGRQGESSTEGSTRASSILRGAGGAAAGAGILSAVFGALDVYSTKSQSALTNAAAADEVAEQQKILAEMQSSLNFSPEEIAAQMQAVSEAIQAQKDTAFENVKAQRRAEFGAGGAVAGAMAGAALGSFIPVIGTMIGGLIGGTLGQFAGEKAAESVNAMSENESKGNADWYKQNYLDAQNESMPASMGAFKQNDEREYSQYLETARLKNEENIRRGAEGIRRHSAGYEPITRSEEIDANIARENWLKDQRLKQQRQFGGQYVGEVTPYQPKDAREKAALELYDAHKQADFKIANEKRRQAEFELARNARDLSGRYEQSAAAITAQQNTTNQLAERQKAFSDAFNNNDGTSFFDSLKNVGAFFDDLFFGKAAAATPEYANQSAENPLAESQGVSNFELPDINALIGDWFTNFELPELGIAETITAEFEGAGAVFDNFIITAQSTFANLGAGIQGALDGAKTAITGAFDEAANQVQSTWNAIPAFFGGVFAGLGGAASAAGSAVYGGLTSVIGSIIGAWQSAAATISGIISTISAAASNAAAAAGNFFSLGSNATGTSNWKGGWTEINEHGGEIINLPRGTQILPHATTTRILKNEIREKINSGADNYRGIPFENYVEGDKVQPRIDFTDGFRKNKIFTRDTIGRIFRRESQPLSGDVIKDIPTPRPFDFSLPNLSLPNLSLPNVTDIFNTLSLPSVEPTANNSTANTLNINGVTINNGANFDEMTFHLQQLLSLAVVNSEFV